MLCRCLACAAVGLCVTRALCLCRDALLAMSPGVENSYVRVPKTVTGADGPGKMVPTFRGALQVQAYHCLSSNQTKCQFSVSV